MMIDVVELERVHRASDLHDYQLMHRTHCGLDSSGRPPVESTYAWETELDSSRTLLSSRMLPTELPERMLLRSPIVC